MVNPNVYVVRHADGFALYPFLEDVASKKSVGTLDQDQVLAAIRYLDVSLIMSKWGAVRWMHGKDATLDDLTEMPVT